LKLKTFTGETSQEALNKVKSEFGDDALIVSTKEIKRKTLTSAGLYEIVVAVEDEPKVNKPQPKPQKQYSNKLENSPTEDVIFKLSQAAKEIEKVSTVPNNNQLEEEYYKSSDDSFELKEIKKELAQVTDKLKLMQSAMWDISSDKRDVIIPPEFSEIYAIAKHSGMDKTHLDNIMKLTLNHMPSKMRHSSVTVKRYFNTLLKKMIPIRVERPLTGNSKKIMMFVGPTGVGKTTTVAKLAARFAFKKEKKYKVGIITLDTYRIGAVEQLMTYAKMMKLSIETVIDPNDFLSALNSLKHNDYILIDTVGSSQHDKEKIDKIYSFLKAVDDYSQIDVNLVLSAATKYEDLKEIYDNFSILPIDTLVFTKLDETSSYGNIFSLVYKEGRPISYFSIGQEVPDDLQVASSDLLINSLFNKKVEK
jgi:flagellar biosynthesis protein FlhF